MAEQYRDPPRQQPPPSGPPPAGPTLSQFQAASYSRPKGHRQVQSGLMQGQDAEKYQAKYRDLKRKVKDIEKDNDELYYKVLQAKKQVSRLRLERGILYEKLSTMPASGETLMGHTGPALYNPITSPQQPHHRPSADYLTGHHLADDINYGEYSRSLPHPPSGTRVITAADGRPLLAESSHSYLSRHDSSRQLPPMQHTLPPTGPPPMDSPRHSEYAAASGVPPPPPSHHHHQQQQSRSQHLPSSSSSRQTRLPPPPMSGHSLLPQHYTHMNPYSPPDRDLERHYSHRGDLNEQDKARGEYEHVRRERDRREIVGDPYQRRPTMHTPPQALPSSSSSRSRAGYTPTSADRDLRTHPEQVELDRSRARDRDHEGPMHSMRALSKSERDRDYAERRHPYTVVSEPPYSREREREHMSASHMRGSSRPPSPDTSSHPPRDAHGRPPMRERTSSASSRFPASRSRDDPTPPNEPPNSAGDRFPHRHRNGGPAGQTSPVQAAYSESGRKRAYQDMDLDEDRESEVVSISAIRGNGRGLPHSSKRSRSPDEP